MGKKRVELLLVLLPICELLKNSRYEKEIGTFWWGSKLHINSRDINIKLWWDNYYMRLQDLKRKSVH
jgi:hypothetical protein